MTGFLLDTNVPSELTRQRPDSRVEKWLDDADDERLFFSVVSLGEIFKGLVVLPGREQTPPRITAMVGQDITSLVSGAHLTLDRTHR